nr:MAG TPA: Protein of unknown function (DUF1353) [Caudoviricetes sp.]
MIKWYGDEEIGIFFDILPKVGVRYFLPTMTKTERESVERYPFINKKELKVALLDRKKSKKYTFTIQKGYCWDGASIPRIFWRLIGSKTDNKFLIPSLIHDVLCENHSYVNNDRYFADKVFERLLRVSEVPAFNRWLMFHSVDNYQKFCGWSKNG